MTRTEPVSRTRESRKGEPTRAGSTVSGSGHRSTVSAGEYLVVKLRPELHPSLVNGTMLNIRSLPLVESVTDMTKISQATLDTILWQPTPLLQRTDPSAYQAVRDYRRRKRQPKLDL